MRALFFVGAICGATSAAPFRDVQRLVAESGPDAHNVQSLGSTINYAALAKKYAPIVVFNPIEKFFFADPVEWLRTASLARGDYSGGDVFNVGLEATRSNHRRRSSWRRTDLTKRVSLLV